MMKLVPFSGSAGRVNFEASETAVPVAVKNIERRTDRRLPSRIGRFAISALLVTAFGVRESVGAPMSSPAKVGTAPGATRCLKFPPEQSLGTLSILAASHKGRVKLGAAQGTIYVPVSARLHLRVDYAGLKSMSSLLLLKPDDIEEIQFDYAPLSDAECRYVAHLTGLKSVSISDTDVGDVGVRVLSTLPKLETLNLTRTDITDNALVDVGKMRNLKRLCVGCNLVTDKGIANLKHLSGLWALELGQTSLTDLGLKSIEPLKELRSLDANGTKITNRGLTSVGKLTNLTRLTLNDLPISDFGLPALKNLKALREIKLHDTLVTIRGASLLRSYAPQCSVAFGTRRPSAEDILEPAADVVETQHNK